MSRENPLLKTLEQWQQAVDERIRAVVPQFASVQELRAEIRRLSERVEQLEQSAGKPNSPPTPSPERQPPE